MPVPASVKIELNSWIPCICLEDCLVLCVWEASHPTLHTGIEFRNPFQYDNSTVAIFVKSTYFDIYVLKYVWIKDSV